MEISSMKQPLALVGVVKNETPFILEWLSYYRIIGISNIIIYDNDTDDDTYSILQKLNEAKIISVTRWRSEEGRSPQLSAYADALHNNKDDFDFIAFFDADEFLEIRDQIGIVDWLRALPSDAGAIAINQRVFGSSGHKEATDELVVERFALAAEENYVENKWVKSIYRTDCLAEFLSPHRGRLSRGRYILPNGRDAFAPDDMSGQAAEIDFSIMKLNHYILKSLDEFMTKRSRGGGAGATQEQRLGRYADMNFFHGRDSRINSVKDTALADMKDQIIREMKLIKKMAGID
jgi:hypothetical protein